MTDNEKMLFAYRISLIMESVGRIEGAAHVLKTMRRVTPDIAASMIAELERSTQRIADDVQIMSDALLDVGDVPPEDRTHKFGCGVAM